MSELSDLINNNDFVIKLRMDDEFDSESYKSIKDRLKINIGDWKAKGFVPVADVVALVELVDFLAGGSRFWDYATSVKAEDAVTEIKEIVSDLIQL